MESRAEYVIKMLKILWNRGHGRFLGMLSEYIDGELEPGARAALEEHLSGCPTCTEELESLRATVQMIRRMPEVEAPRSFRLAPASASVSGPQPERPFLLWTMRASTALAAAAFTVMLAGSVTGLWGGGGSEEEGGTAASGVEMAYDIPVFEPTALPLELAMEDAAEESLPVSEAMMDAESEVTPEPAGAPAPMPRTSTGGDMEDGGGKVVTGLTIGVGGLAVGLGLGTLYLTLRRRRGVGSS